MNTLTPNRFPEQITREMSIDEELNEILHNPDSAIASYEMPATVTDPNDLQEPRIRELRQHRQELLREVSGLQGEALEKLMSDPVASFRSVVEGLGDMYQHRSFVRNHGDTSTQHFATRNEKRDDIDLHFWISSNKDGEQQFMGLETDLQGQLKNPCRIESGPDGKFDIYEMVYEYDKNEHFWTTNKKPVEPVDELVILSAVFADAEYAVHAYDPKNDEQAQRLLAKHLNRR